MKNESNPPARIGWRMLFFMLQGAFRAGAYAMQDAIYPDKDFYLLDEKTRKAFASQEERYRRTIELNIEKYATRITANN